MSSINASFQWACQPHAENLIVRILDESSQANPFIASFGKDLHTYASTRLFDWIDHVIVEYSSTSEKELETTGFISDSTTASYRVYRHPGAQLPAVILKEDNIPGIGIAVSVESIADFLMVRGRAGWIEGSPYSPFRRCAISTDNNATLWVIERRGTRSMEPIYCDPEYAEKYLESMERWQSRPRDLEDESESITRTLSLAQELVSVMGKDLAAWIILDCERRYWQSRNTAGQLQKNRQDRLGMGWANHDHHTFRSSRRHFTSLVRLFEILGFHCRERYYAGEEAGWGAQIMENSEAKLVLFLDVDLAPEELEIDFAHHSLPELDNLGTIGLWCELHGDSILKAGMHHLEAQFLFDVLTRDLSHLGVGMMEPFSNFSYLRQAFTAGEIWHVDEARLKRLIASNLITAEEKEKFSKYGAVGSHLENLQRREGYKGFNQKNVSSIIKKTDPRKIQV